MKKYPISFRLTEIAQRLIDCLANHLGLSKTGVIEMAVRELARREGVYYAGTEGAQDSAEDKLKG